MGMFFDNIHIRKNAEFNLEQLEKHLIDQMAEKGFALASGTDDGDLSVVIYEPENSDWISVASDDYQFSTMEGIKSKIRPISNMFHTDVIAAACNDSDYLMLNIVNTSDGTDGWINIGRLYGMESLHPTCTLAWRDKVTNYFSFKKIEKKQYTFAEDAFCDIAELINMQPCQTSIGTDYVSDLNPDKLHKLSFVAPALPKLPPQLEIGQYDLMPCRPGESEVIFVNNQGGKSKGIGVMFVGDYVENDEITFHDVTFESDYGSEKRKVVPIELKKGELTNGQKAYYWEDKAFVIPPAVSKDIPLLKRMELEFKKEFGVRFVPEGNPRKMLDITVVIYPLENKSKGQAVWCVYSHAGTKEEYIKRNNENWHGIDPGNELDPNDFDL